jgi:hypothetical protein
MSYTFGNCEKKPKASLLKTLFYQGKRELHQKHAAAGARLRDGLGRQEKPGRVE